MNDNNPSPYQNLRKQSGPRLVGAARGNESV